MASLTAAVPLSPSDLLPYIDGQRAVELCYSDREVGVSGFEYPDEEDIDDIAKAVTACNSAWNRLVSACRKGEIYTARELVDLANDADRGAMLRELVSDLFWGTLIKRRRYVKGEPQGEEQSKETAETQLEQLESGHRIFVLDGVAVTDSSGTPTGQTYGNERSVRGAMSVGGPDQTRRDPLDRFWGCTGQPERGDSGYSGGSGRCC